MYLITWSVRRRTKGSFEVESLDEIPAELAKLAAHLEDEMGLEIGDEEDLRYELEVDGVYESVPVEFDEDDIWAKAWPLIEAKNKKQEEARKKDQEDQERRERDRLNKKYGDS